ncbi:MAG: four helix bundle protein [Nitrospiraceae bacterium]|nr:four helix bundle protein [Nitrospiraceae bacterium]MSR23879.1 four helix bundle protein [Nitrospiraceae bacterium]
MKKPHKKLDAWRMALDLVLTIYRETDRFPEQERYSLTSQIRRSALSVPSNIAEGAARQTKKEFINFLHIAQGSLSELDTQLEVAKELGYLDKDRWTVLDDQIERIDKMISGLIRHLKNSRRLEHAPSPHALRLTPHA